MVEEVDKGDSLPIVVIETRERVVNKDMSFHFHYVNHDSFAEDEFVLIWIGCVGLVVHSDTLRREVVLAWNDKNNRQTWVHQAVEGELKSH